jgi:hypothetical protein
MMRSLGAQSETFSLIITRGGGKLDIFLGLDDPEQNFVYRSGVRGRGKRSLAPEFLEAWFTGDNFLGNVVDHGLGALFSYQTR